MNKISYERKWKKRFLLRAKKEHSDAEIGIWSEEGFRVRKEYFLKYFNLPFGQNLKVLDLGCGSGAYTRLLGEQGFDVTGIDYIPDIVKIAKDRTKNPNIKYEVATASSLSFPDAYFDAVICISIFQCLSSPFTSLREIRRVLRPGGKAFIITLNDLSVYCWAKRIFGRENIRRYNPYHFKKIVKDCNFSLIKIQGVYLTPSSLINNIILKSNLYKIFNLLFPLFVFFSHSFCLIAIKQKKQNYS